jgi:hypothetical protein
MWLKSAYIKEPTAEPSQSANPEVSDSPHPYEVVIEL